MDSIVFAFNGVFPILVYMTLGYLSRRLKMADVYTYTQMNSLVFKVFLPILIYINIYHSNILTMPLGGPIAYAIGATLVIFFASWALFARVEPIPRRRGVMIQAMFRSNYVLFGVPLVVSLLPDGGSGLTEILIAIVIPMYNLLAVFILQYYSKESMSLKGLVAGIFKNPLIIASILGILTLILQLDLPIIVESTLSRLGQVATPLALFVLGGQFFFSETRGYLRHLLIAVSSRLIIVPLIFISLAVLAGLRGEVLVSYLALFGGPVAVSSYTMTQQMDAEHELAGQILVYTSIFCLVTLFIFIAVMRQVGLI